MKNSKPDILIVDFVYITCGHGIYVLRPEQKRFSYIQTSGVAKLIDYVNAEHKNPEKNFIPLDETMTVRNVIDCRYSEIRFDGITRVVAISSRKLLIILEKGQMYDS